VLRALLAYKPRVELHQRGVVEHGQDLALPGQDVVFDPVKVFPFQGMALPENCLAIPVARPSVELFGCISHKFSLAVAAAECVLFGN
jgi:hypothetical protein